MRRPSAMARVVNVFRTRAAEHGWRALTFPLAPFLSHTGRGRGDVGWLARKNVGPLTQWSDMHGTSLMQNPSF